MKGKIIKLLLSNSLELEFWLLGVKTTMRGIGVGFIEVIET